MSAPSRLASALSLSLTDAAWLAGVLDCDGSIRIANRPQPTGRATSYIAEVRVGQTRAELVTRCAQVTGVGNLYCDGRGVWTWQATSAQGAFVLRQVVPYLVLKRRQAEVAIELADRVTAYGASGTRRVDAAEQSARASMYLEVRDLNRPRPREVPCPR